MRNAIILMFILIGLILTTAIIVSPQIGAQAILVPQRITPNTIREHERVYERGFFMHPREAKLNTEEVEITSRSPLPPALPADSAVKLKGWFTKTQKDTSGKTLIILHDVGQSKWNLISMAKYYDSLGYNTLLIDQRAHGLSTGKFCTYGYHEKYDVLAMIEYLKKRPDVKSIGILGLSMGAAVAIQAATLDTTIKALVLQNPYKDLRSATQDYGRKTLSVLSDIMYPLVAKTTEKQAKFRFDDIDMIRDIKKVHIPTLFILSENDRDVPFARSNYVYLNANNPKTLWKVPNAEHFNILHLSAKSYFAKTDSFFKKHL
ncbi:MAG: alpha/beta hydrolase [Bacteroidia bacterium]|nr:alpha/beta hydrolase [Bacteroidia bacterium]MDW8346852.1 alpha/beta hydrolase [Bacteroidia bacterium]